MQHRRFLLVTTALAFLALAPACTPAQNPDDAPADGSGGSGTGGRTGSGGSTGSGTGGSGGTSSGATGGSPAATGGGGESQTGTGGTPGGTGGDGAGTGGSSGTGGDSTGGGGGDAAASADVAGTGGAAGAGTDGGPSPLMECSMPSIDRLTWWKATGEGVTVPKAEGTSLLVKEGDHYVAKEQFVGSADWHVFEIIVGPKFESSADLSKSTGFWLTYNTTADLYMQMRPASKYDGGAQWATKIPSTGGQTKQAFFSFEAKNWAGVAELGNPSLSYASTVNQVRGLLLVGKAANVIAISQLRIDNFAPACP